jgi:hypothetical protein
MFPPAGLLARFAQFTLTRCTLLIQVAGCPSQTFQNLAFLDRDPFGGVTERARARAALQEPYLNARLHPAQTLNNAPP